MKFFDYLSNLITILFILMLAETIFIIYLIIKNEFKSTKNKHEDICGGSLYPRKPTYCPRPSMIEREKREKP